MKNKNPHFLTNLAITLFVVATMALATARPAEATLGATSAGATIHNVVQVAYKLTASGVVTYAWSNVDVTVLTVPTTATLGTLTGQSVSGGSVVNYATYLRSNANGPDTYTLTNSIGTNTAATVQTGQSTTPAASLLLWGGISTVAGATSTGLTGTIGFPGGSIATAGGLAVGDTVEILTTSGLKRYTVVIGGIVAGNKNTQAAGLPTNENPDVVTLTPVSGMAADQIGTATALVPVGTQVGEYAAVSITLTAGVPNTPGIPGTNVTNLSALGAATTAAGTQDAAATASVTTTVNSAVLTIVKKSRILLPTDPINGTSNIVPASYDTTVKTAKFGQKIEYLITVTNPSGNADASSVIITDPTPAYTTVVSGSQSSGVVTPVGTTPVTSVTVTPNATAVWSGTPADFGPLAGNSDLQIVYQVTVN